MTSTTPVLDADRVRGVKPVLPEGERVVVTSGPNAGRSAVIVGHEFADDTAYLQYNTPNHPKRQFAKVTRYRLNTRDSRAERISATPDQIEARSTIEGWGRGWAPEEAPTGEGVEAKEAGNEVVS